MDDATAQKVREALDVALKTASINVGIAFGDDLFREFRARNWLTLEKFGLLGTGLFAVRLPAYDKTHHAFESWDVPAGEFRVGSDA